MWSLHLRHCTHGYHAALNEPTSDVATSRVVARVRKFLLRTGKLFGGGALDPVGSSAGGKLRRRLKEALNTTTVSQKCLIRIRGTNVSTQEVDPSRTLSIRDPCFLRLN